MRYQTALLPVTEKRSYSTSVGLSIVIEVVIGLFVVGGVVWFWFFFFVWVKFGIVWCLWGVCWGWGFETTALGIRNYKTGRRGLEGHVTLDWRPP